MIPLRDDGGAIQSERPDLNLGHGHYILDGKTGLGRPQELRFFNRARRPHDKADSLIGRRLDPGVVLGLAQDVSTLASPLVRYMSWWAHNRALLPVLVGLVSSRKTERNVLFSLLR